MWAGPIKRPWALVSCPGSAEGDEKGNSALPTLWTGSAFGSTGGLFGDVVTSQLARYKLGDRRERLADTNPTNRHRGNDRPGVGVERIGDRVCSKGVR